LIAKSGRAAGLTTTHDYFLKEACRFCQANFTADFTLLLRALFHEDGTRWGIA
jgi:hypothetical protein